MAQEGRAPYANPNLPGAAMTIQTAHHLAYQILAPIGQQLGGGAHVYRCETTDTRAHCLGALSSPWQEFRLRIGMHQLADGTIKYSIRGVQVVSEPTPDPGP